MLLSCLSPDFFMNDILDISLIGGDSKYVGNVLYKGQPIW